MGGPPWRIQIKRSGGVTGVTLGGEIRSEDLSATEADELTRLLGRVDLSASPSALDAGAQRDRFQYSIVAEHGADRYEVTTGEKEMDEPLGQLVNWLMARIRTSRAPTQSTG